MKFRVKKEKVAKPKQTQIEVVANVLRNNGTITSYEGAYKYGILYLPMIIHLLRQRGFVITSVFKHTLNRYGKKIRYAEFTYVGESLCRMEETV